jgi:hypothetical protein
VVAVADVRRTFPEVGEEAHQVAPDPAAQAPALCHEQIDSIRAVIVGGRAQDGGDGDDT